MHPGSPALALLHQVLSQFDAPLLALGVIKSGRMRKNRAARCQYSDRHQHQNTQALPGDC